MANFSFDARTVEPDEGRLGAVPAGWYPLSMDQSEIKPTASADGSYLNTRFQILDGPHKGAFVYHRFNTKNQSEKAMEIGYKQLSALMHAIKVLTINKTEEMHNKPFFAKLKFVAADGQYESKNEITAFREITDPAAKQGFQSQLAAASGTAVQKTVVPPAKTQPPAQTVAKAAPAAGGGWTPPAQTQPWGNTSAVAAPASSPAATATAQVTSTETQTSETVSAPAQQVQPSWAAAPAEQTTAPVQQTTTAPAQESTSAPESTGETLPPWMQ